MTIEPLVSKNGRIGTAQVRDRLRTPDTSVCSAPLVARRHAWVSSTTGPQGYPIPLGPHRPTVHNLTPLQNCHTITMCSLSVRTPQPPERAHHRRPSL